MYVSCMKKSPSKSIWMFAIMAAIVCTYTMTVFAQITNVPPVPPIGGIPQSKGEFWDLGIAAVTPIIVWLVRLGAPKIPSVLLPSITPFIGIGLGLLLNKLAGANLSWVDMAKAGALAVMIREVVNQAITQPMAGRPISSPAGPVTPVVPVASTPAAPVVPKP